MNTTLNKIREKSPCTSGWNTLLKSLGKTQPDDEPVSLDYILKSNGIEDAVWCLRCFDYKNICLFCADVAESVLPIFEKKCPDDKIPRKAIEGIRLFKNNEITLDDLALLRKDADDADDAAGAAAYAAGAAAYAANAANAAADASAVAAVAAVAAAYADDADDADDAGKEQWKITEQLFIKHFCVGDNNATG